MLDISYNEYPTILYTSFDVKSGVESLPMVAGSKKVKNYLLKNKGLETLMGYIGYKNSQKGENNNVYYYLDDSTYRKVDSDGHFRSQYFNVVLKNGLDAKHGVILFRNSGQYVYAILDEEETKKLYNRNGRYVAVALFSQNLFVGFEEGFLHEHGFDLSQTGIIQEVWTEVDIYHLYLLR